MTTTISPLPTPPTPADSPVDFNTKAFALLGGLPTFVAEANAQAAGLDASVAAAGAQAAIATNKAGEALTSANNAAISKTGADSARDAAVIAKNAAEAALDSFDDRYLGAKAVAPTTDNDGGALLTGALYWDTVLPGMRSWNGGAWVTLPAATKASVGLANVDNTSDANKPVSAAQAAAIAERYGKNNVLGTVSQSAGVPTGAVIERGSNVNGDYVRFADGTQICTVSSTFTAAASVVWTYPATFVAKLTYLSASAKHTVDPQYYNVDIAATGGNVSATLYRSLRANNAAVVDPFLVNCVAIGRWF